MTDADNHKFTRRDLTKALGAVGTASLAGCPSLNDGDGRDGDSDGGSDNQELGERVPSIGLNYFTGIYSTRFAEIACPNVQGTWGDMLGVDIEIQGKDVGSYVGEIVNGTYNYHLAFWSAQSFPQRLDPNWIVRDCYRIDGAGSRNQAGISLNYARYASCDYSEPAWQQETAPDESSRRDLVNSAIKQLAEDYMSIPLGPQAIYGAYDSSALDMDDIGSYGIANSNAFNVLRSHPKNGTEKVIATPIPDRIANRNPYMSPNPISRLVLEYSTLLAFGPDAELQPYLAEDWEVSDGAKTFTFTLRDATFQNGDPITASDVKFTFEFLENNAEDLAGAAPAGYESIETPDDKTVVVNFAEPALPFLRQGVIKVGILNEDIWAEADGNAADFTPPMGTASGPMTLTGFESKRRVEMETHTGHPEAPDPSDMDALVIRGYNNENTMVQALGAGEVMTTASMGYGSAQQAREFDNVETTSGLAHIPFTINPSYAQAPTKFKEFRQALGMAVNRREIAAVGFPESDIDIEFSPRPYWRSHPWAAPAESLPTFTDKPTGDREGARQVLADAGWGWDDQGNLHYPPDADLSPRWPDGEAPAEEDYPCLSKILG